MTRRKRNNMIAVAVLCVIAILGTIVGKYQLNPKSTSLSVTYSTAEENTGASGRVSKRLVLDTKASEEEIRQLISKEASKTASKDLYIYVYNPGAEINSGNEWVAMFSRVNGKDQTIALK